MKTGSLNILITGGAGVMGTALVHALRKQGHRLRVLTLPGDPGAKAIQEYADVRFGNVADDSSLEGLCDGIDTVYHLAAIIIAQDPDMYRSVNVEGTGNVLNRARDAGVEHFIHVSSASVVYPKPTPYSLSKRACEQSVRDGGIPFTIVRPTLVYDHGKGGQEFDIFLNYLIRYPIVPFIGTGRSLKRPVFVGDLVEGLLAIAGNPDARGKTYNLSGGEAISIMDFARLCLKCAGKEGKPILPVPVWLCKSLAFVLERIMTNPPLRWPVIAGITQDADLDPSQACRDLGYAPLPVSEKLPACFPRV